jgi:hypothetical protein
VSRHRIADKVLRRSAALGAVLLLSLAPASAGRAAETPPPPTLSYWHVWTDADGHTHQTVCKLQRFELKTINPPASPQWQDLLKSGDATVIATVQPAGWTGTWHENPKPQWIIPLSGRWFVETTDGTRTLMGPGEASFGEDQNSKADARGRRGHLSGTVGSEPAVLMVIQLDQPPTTNAPCHLR